MPTPAWLAGPPLPATVQSPSRKSTGASGMARGLQRNWFGVAGCSSKRLWNPPSASSSNGACCAPGWMR
jgi:hypothetical protein